MNWKTLFIPIIIFMIIINCAQPKEPVGPNWTLSLTKIPVIGADTIEVGKELEGENIQGDANNLIHINFTETVEFSIDDQMHLAAAYESFVGGPNIPSQRFAFGTQIPINNSTEFSVDSALIAQGEYYIEFFFESNFSYDVQLEISIPQLKDEFNAPFFRSVSVPQWQSQNRFYISGHKIILNGQNLNINVVIDIPQTTWNSGSYVSINVGVSQLDFSQMTADISGIHEQFMDVNETLFSDPPEGLNNFQLEQADFELKLLNVPFNLETDFDIITEKRGQTSSLIWNESISANDNSAYGFDIAGLISNMPEQITISGSGTVSGTNVTLTRGTTYYMEYSLDVPLEFSITQQSTIQETDVFELDEDARDAIKDNLVNTGLEGTIINETPFSGTLKLYVGQNESLTNMEIFSISLPVRGSEGTIDLSLDENDLNLLADARYYRYYVTLDTVTNAQVKSTDYIIVKQIYISGSGKIDLEDLDDDDDE